MASVKSSTIPIEPFDSHVDFTVWQQGMKRLLTREGTIKALKVKTRRTKKMTDDEWMALREKDNPKRCDRGVGRFERHGKEYNIAVSANTTRWEVLGLANLVDIWDKLKSRYKSKSLTSRLYLKK